MINSPICSRNVLYVVFQHKCNVFSTNADVLTKVFNCSDHIGISGTIELPHIVQNGTRELYWNFDSADFDKIAIEMEQTLFLSTCFTNIDKFYEELEEYQANLIRRNVPSRTRHRQCLPPWIKPSTSHLLRKLETQKKRLVLRPTSYRKSFVAKLQKLVSELIEQDCKEYQNHLPGSRTTGLIFKHLKRLIKDSNFHLKWSTTAELQIQPKTRPFFLIFSSTQSFSTKSPSESKILK